MKYGAVAQMGERLPCTEEVAGSSPVSSTDVEVPEWSNGVDCKSIIREFESHPLLNII